MTKFMIDIDSNSTKTVEIRALRKIQENVPAGSYLAGVFSPELVAWVESQIKMDIMPDIYQWYLDSEAAYCEAKDELNQVYDKANDMTRKMAEMSLEHEQQMSDLLARHETYVENSEKHEQRLRELSEGRRETVQDLETKLDMQSNVIDGLHQEILLLKAKLYDMGVSRAD